MAAVFYFTRGERILITLLLAALVAGGATFLFLKGKQAGQSQSPFFVESPLAGDKADLVTVHVAGEVRQPGVVTLPAHARVRDAIAKAGGLTDKADPGCVNLAAEVLDGQKIEVRARSASSGSASEGSETPAPGGLKAGERISINTAGAEQLQRLPGIGPGYAQRIIAYRRELQRTTGQGFTATEQLMNIPGIGPKRYADMKEHVRL